MTAPRRNTGVDRVTIRLDAVERFRLDFARLYDLEAGHLWIGVEA